MSNAEGAEKVKIPEQLPVLPLRDMVVYPFIIAPLSNGNIALMTDMARNAGLPWDCVLGAELVRHYKPDREVYQSAADFLDLAPADVMMVAAHLGDLRAAKTVGLKTAFVARPLAVPHCVMGSGGHRIDGVRQHHADVRRGGSERGLYGCAGARDRALSVRKS